MTTGQLQDLIVKAKVKGYTSTKTDAGWLVEQTTSALGRRLRFATRYRIASDQDLIRVLARLIEGGKVGVGYPTTAKAPSPLPPLAATHSSKVWGPSRR